MTSRRPTKLKLISDIYTKKSGYWEERLKQFPIEFAKRTIKNVPAYSSFASKRANLKTHADFLNLPITDKSNYLRRYGWKELCVKKSIQKESLVFTSTSGSTGKPFYFPRTDLLDTQSSVSHEIFLKNSGIDTNKSTLVIVCFGMGVWIGGLITYQAFKKISERGYSLSIITPGVNKKEIYEALKNVAPNYDQVIICGYPPFIKDVIDEGPINGINWRGFNLKIVFAAETFSEAFRDYVARKASLKNALTDTMNIYGSADLGTMAQETPLSILVRRLALRNDKIFKKLFADANRLPTLAQFIPEFIYFESCDGVILCTGGTALPLVRYNIGDNGVVRSFSDVKNIFKAEGIDLYAEAKKQGISKTLAELPFVAVYERSDFSTKLYGAIIYPEYVRHGLSNVRVLKHVTGKFSMLTVNDKNMDEVLEIHVEMRPGLEADKELERKICSAIVEALVEHSAEYKNNLQMMSERVHPKIILWPHEHSLYFKTGIKQKWVKK